MFGNERQKLSLRKADQLPKKKSRISYVYSKMFFQKSEKMQPNLNFQKCLEGFVCLMALKQKQRR